MAFVEFDIYGLDCTKCFGIHACLEITVQFIEKYVPLKLVILNNVLIVCNVYRHTILCAQKSQFSLIISPSEFSF